ncbi:hypothetical protein JCM17960_04820 [Magnetospira thiophila]
MTLSLALVLLTSAGIGLWLPLRGLGSRAFLGWAIFPFLLFVLARIVGLPLHIAAWVLLGLAMGGLVMEGWRQRHKHFSPDLLLHPLLSFGALLLVFVALWGPQGYIPLEWDELSNWLSLTRQMFIADEVWRADMELANPGYTQGWYLAMVYPQLFHDEFIEVRSLAAGTAGVLCFLGFAWDLLRGQGDFQRTVIAWGSVSGLLLLWPLGWLPDNLLIEPPQLLLISSLFLLLARFSASDDSHREILLCAGLLLGAGYFLKIAGIVSLLLLPFLWWRSGRARILPLALLLLLPFAVVYVTWKLFGNPAPATFCIADPIAVLTGGQWETLTTVSDPFFQRLMSLLTLRAQSAWSLLGLAGLVLAALIRPYRLLALAAGSYLVVYTGLLLWTYASCFQSYERETLISLERYMGLAFDALSLAGVLVLIEGLYTRVAPKVTGRGFGLATALLVLAALGVTLTQADKQAVRLADPFAPGHPYPAAFVEKRQPVRQSMADLRRLVQATHSAHDLPTVTLIAQNSDGFERILLRYLAHGSQRGGPLNDFQVMPSHSWSGQGATWSASAAQAKQDFDRSDIIWPRQVDQKLGQVLGQYVDSQICGDNVRAFFLWRADPGAPHRCVLNEGLVRYYEQLQP